MSSPTAKDHHPPEADRTITIGSDHSLMKYSLGRDVSRQNYIPRNVDPKGDGAQDEITGAEPGGENISSADRCVEEEEGRIRSNIEENMIRKKMRSPAAAQAGRHQRESGLI